LIDTALETRQIYKAFNKNEVLHGVDFKVGRNEIHGLVGGNGAGKSTLMKIVNGIYTKDSGTIFVDGVEVKYSTSTGAKDTGISMVYQEFSLVPTMSVAENLFLAREPIKNGFIDKKVALSKAYEVFNKLNVKIDPLESVEDLSVGNMQLTEIAKALVLSDTKVLILDEPTASLSNIEIQSLFKAMREIRDKGVAIILVSHHLQEIVEICDKVTVLRDGISVLTKLTAQTDLNEIIAAMLGFSDNEHAYEYIPPSVSRTEKPVLKVKNLNWQNRIIDVSFSLYGGEVVGLVGVTGSGRTEILNILFGLVKPDSGTIIVDGKPTEIGHPNEAIARGISMVPENRRTCGIIADQSIRMNVLLPIWKRITKLFLIKDTESVRLTKEYIEKMDVKCNGTEQEVGSLSGGNQQRVVFAKSLISEPKVFLLDDPTVGIDIAAKATVSKTVRKLADEGKAVLIVSGEFDEIAKVADRVYIIMAGKIKREIVRGQEEISEASLLSAIYEV
jgi:ribose transport system ATP-binding protein